MHVIETALMSAVKAVQGQHAAAQQVTQGVESKKKIFHDAKKPQKKINWVMAASRSMSKIVSKG